MKIALVNYTAFPYHGYGGAERYVYFLARELVQSGHEVSIITLRYNERHGSICRHDGIVYRFLSRPFYGYFELDERGVGRRIDSERQLFDKINKFLFRFFFWLQSLIVLRKNNFDIVHSFSDSGFPITFTSIKHVATLFDIGNRGLTRRSILRLPLSKGSYYSYTTSQIVRGASLLTSGGIDNTRELVEIFNGDEEKIWPLSNAVDFEQICTVTTEEKTALKIGLGFKKESRVFLIAGRLEPNKNPIKGIELFAQISIDSSRDVRLIVVGDGSLSSEIDARIVCLNDNEKDPRVIRFRNLSDHELYRLMQACDVMLNFADTRYMLLTVMEAMACGSTIISSQKLDGIIEDQNNGYILGNLTVSDITALIIDLMEDDNKLGLFKTRAKKEVRGYTWKNTRNQALAAYEHLVNK